MNDLEKALRYNPFDGDFGEPGDRCLRDKIVTFRKGGKCVDCLDEIVPGTRGRSLTMLWADRSGPITGRYCKACTEAQATAFEDEGKALDARWNVRRRHEAAA